MRENGARLPPYHSSPITALRLADVAGAEARVLRGGGRVELDAVAARHLVHPSAVGQVVDAERAVAYDGPLHGGGRGGLLPPVRVERLSRRALRAEEGAR